ncbi:MAG: hypothetical protein DMG02_34130 [Acidobacteria bacterium]|nr:MAG: hypothetical protein DMG02_34130 [Acidobacteriota bacterium]
MGIGKYILDAQQQPVEEPELLTWGRWMETAERHVAVDQVRDVKVSTIFLGLDTRDAAIAGHAAMLARVLAHTETGTP